MKHTVTVLPEGKTFTVDAGTRLLDGMRTWGVFADAPCGGRGSCGKCMVFVNGESVLACRYPVERDVTVELPEKEAPGTWTGEIPVAAGLGSGLSAAFDIGTTTVVCALLDRTGKTMTEESMENPQRAFGADVVTRVTQAVKGQGKAMTAAIRGAMEDLLLRCCGRTGVSPADIETVSVVGNPCMQQLFLDMPLDNLATVPYAPVVTAAKRSSADSCLPSCSNATLLTVPALGGFVGADTMGCILASGIWESQETVLLVDIGTNGEMVLCHRGRLAACSTAAGPALEGANISCGMRAAAGAVDHVTPDGIHVIGGGSPRGICGSGLIDAVAVMLEAGILNRRGRILTEDHSYELVAGVTLTQEDIRQVQLAKGAIAAGIRQLTAHFGIGPEDIDRCLLAGAFGSYMDPDNACRIGLLPEQLRGRITAAGNLALEGAKLLAADADRLALTQRIANRVEFLELASLSGFRRSFAENMFFREENHG